MKLQMSNSDLWVSADILFCFEITPIQQIQIVDKIIAI